VAAAVAAAAAANSAAAAAVASDVEKDVGGKLVIAIALILLVKLKFYSVS